MLIKKKFLKRLIIIFLALCLVSATILPVLFVQAKEKTFTKDDLEITFESGCVYDDTDGFVINGETFVTGPVKIKNKSNADFNGFLKVSNEKFSVSYEINVPAKSSETFIVDFYDTLYTQNNIISLYDKDNNLISKCLLEDGLWGVNALVLTDNITSKIFDGAHNYENDNGSLDTLNFNLTNVLQSEPISLSIYKFILIDDFDTSTLSDEQINALRYYLNNEGTLIVCTGKNYKKTLSGLNDIFFNVEVKDVKNINTSFSLESQITELSLEENEEFLEYFEEIWSDPQKRSDLNLMYFDEFRKDEIEDMFQSYPDIEKEFNNLDKEDFDGIRTFFEEFDKKMEEDNLILRDKESYMEYTSLTDLYKKYCSRRIYEVGNYSILETIPDKIDIDIAEINNLSKNQPVCRDTIEGSLSFHELFTTYRYGNGKVVLCNISLFDKSLEGYNFSEDVLDLFTAQAKREIGDGDCVSDNLESTFSNLVFKDTFPPVIVFFIAFVLYISSVIFVIVYTKRSKSKRYNLLILTSIVFTFGIFILTGFSKKYNNFSEKMSATVSVITDYDYISEKNYIFVDNKRNLEQTLGFERNYKVYPHYPTKHSFTYNSQSSDLLYDFVNKECEHPVSVSKTDNLNKITIDSKNDYSLFALNDVYASNLHFEVENISKDSSDKVQSFNLINKTGTDYKRVLVRVNHYLYDLGSLKSSEQISFNEKTKRFSDESFISLLGSTSKAFKEEQIVSVFASMAAEISSDMYYYNNKADKAVIDRSATNEPDITVIAFPEDTFAKPLSKDLDIDRKEVVLQFFYGETK